MQSQRSLPKRSLFVDLYKNAPPFLCNLTNSRAKERSARPRGESAFRHGAVALNRIKIRTTKRADTRPKVGGIRPKQFKFIPFIKSFEGV